MDPLESYEQVIAQAEQKLAQGDLTLFERDQLIDSIQTAHADLMAQRMLMTCVCGKCAPLGLKLS